MYVLKHCPEDFIVTEVSSIIGSTGDYALYWMTKRNYTTPDAIARLAQALHRQPKDFGFAGNKDKKAITSQMISLFKGSRKDIDIDVMDIDLEFKGFSSKKVALGDLDGNSFEIVVRNLDLGDIEKLTMFASCAQRVPNFFGPQRFSLANAEIGRELVKKKFSHALELIKEHDKAHQNIITAFLKSNPHNAIAALRLVPSHALKMYIHAYQSFLFNEMLKRALIACLQPSSLPLIGFGTEIDSYPVELRSIIDAIMVEEKITLRDFINKQMPELSSEGGSRDAFFNPKDFAIQRIENDEAFEGKKKALVTFTLQKSCYATTLLSFVLEN